MPRDDDTQPVPWVGRAPAPRRRDLADTAEQPIVPSQLAPPPVLYVERPRRRAGVVVGLMLICFAAGATVALLASPGLRGAVGIGPDPHSSSSPSPSPSPSPTEPPPPGIGDPVRDTAVEFVVTEVVCGQETVGEGIFTRRASGQFCVVGFVLRNVGGALAVLSVNDQYAVTVDGERHHADGEATAIVNGSLFVWSTPVLPGDSVIGDLVFDLPGGATLESLELHDSGNSEGAVITVPQPA